MEIEEEIIRLVTVITSRKLVVAGVLWPYVGWLKTEFHGKPQRFNLNQPSDDDESRIHTGDVDKVSKTVLNDSLRYVGGVDISFVKSDENKACVALVVLELPSLEIVYSAVENVHVSVPYVAGFLAFREVPPIIQCIDKLKEKAPDLIPQVILVDGNGILHHREFGSACHLGVKSGIPCVGVAKNLLNIDGMQRDEEFHEKVNSLTQKFDSFSLIGTSSKLLGKAIKTSEKCKNPVFVSVGHSISLETALWVVEQCSLYRIPEPIRQADIISRACLREQGLL